MTRLAEFQPTGATQVARILHHMANQVRRKGIVIVISDFFDDEAEMIEGIQHLRFAGHEVIVMQVLDPHELDFPLTGMVEFEGLEGIPSIQTRPTQIRNTYLREFGAFRQRLRDGLRAERVPLPRGPHRPAPRRGAHQLPGLQDDPARPHELPESSVARRGPGGRRSRSSSTSSTGAGSGGCRGPRCASSRSASSRTSGA